MKFVGRLLMNNVIKLNEDITTLGREDFQRLENVASAHPSNRARFCLHHSDNDLVQQMIICLAKDSYVRPHRHINKAESFHIIKGEILVVVFNEDGSITKKIIMSASDELSCKVYRLAPGLWHTVIPLSSAAIFHEVTSGPFLKEESEFSKWSPEINDFEAIKNFRKSIMSQENCILSNVNEL